MSVESPLLISDGSGWKTGFPAAFASWLRFGSSRPRNVQFVSRNDFQDEELEQTFANPPSFPQSFMEVSHRIGPYYP
jgi:phytoene dehydrogenase-like protein